MSLTGSLNISPYSLTGINNFDGTVNGLVPVSVITIAGQTAFLSWNTSTTTLTLVIPTSDGIVALGLLSSTDWNTFNNKENTLSFTSPLRRIANVIDFDFSTANTFTGVNTFSNTVNFNHNIQFNALPLATTSNILYIDLTGLVSYGAVPPDLIPLNNIWTGATNRFQNALVVENENNSTYPFLVYRSQLLFPDFTYMDNAGKMGYYDGTDKWTIDRFGQFIGGSIIVNDFIQATNNIEPTNGILGGLGLNITSSSIYLQSPIATTNNYSTLSFDTGTKQVGYSPSLLGTTNTFAGNNTFNNDVNITIGGITHVVFNSNYQTTWYEPTGDTMSYLVKNGVTSLKWVVFRSPTSYAYYDTTANVLSTTSDARTKKNIRAIDIEKSKQFILSITPSIFQHKDGDVTDTNVIGFIAQDILLNAKTEAQKNIVANWRPYEKAMAKQEDPKDILGVSSTLIIPELVGTIQLLNKQIEKLETQNKTLLERLEAIEYKIKRNDTILRY
jgi:hypothetical protein